MTTTEHAAPRKGIRPPLVTEPPRRSRSSFWVASTIIVIVATAVGEVVSTVRSSMLPWVFGRGLGLASFAALAALSVVGLWRRHPLRETWPLLKPASLAKVHTVLASATMALLAGHVIAIVVDSYARVGLIGALVPMQSAYQPWPVTLGTISLWLLLAIWATARMSKSIAKRSWKAIHRASMFTFGCVWLHGLTIGTDTPRLRPAYISIGAVIVTVWLSSVALQTVAFAKKRSVRS